MHSNENDSWAVTALLSVSLVGAYAAELTGNRDATCAVLGFTPAHPSLQTALTSMWLHDPHNLFHLGGNLVFLIIFGAIVEKAIGGLRLLALFVAAGLAGAALHWSIDPSSMVPLVGASGAIYGLLAPAAILRPRMLGFVIAFVAINVWHAFVGADGSASFAAHIGGFAVGALGVFYSKVRYELFGEA